MNKQVNIQVGDTYDAMSKQAAEELLQLLQAIENPLICVASGASPAGLYKELVNLISSKQVNTSNWLFVGLDEWIGLDANVEGSSRNQLNSQLFQPLQVKEENICFYNGKAGDLNKECERIENFVNQHNAIDVAILGIGVNGHIGMNEPGTSPSLRSHIADIHPDTQQIGQKYFKQPQKIDEGLTLGLATLLEAKHIFLLASGPSKADVMHKMLHEEISEQIPATLLREHGGLTIYLDKEAAVRIEN